MSEQRFYITDTGLGLDTVSDEMYSFGNEEDFCRLFDKLNEQQDTISQLKEENKELGKNFDDLVKWASEISKRNVILDERIGEQQSIINKLREEEKLYAKEILRLNNLLKQYQSFEDLGGDY